MMDAKHLTLSLGGKWYRSYGAAPCPVCQREGQKEQYALTLAEGRNGLLLNCKKSGCDFREILAATGFAPGAYAPPDPRVAVQREADRRQDSVKRAAQAQRLWEGAHLIRGSLADTYLRGRGIACPLPESLRFAPSCSHASAKRFPAMVARVEGCDALAVHRTYLRADGMGKADVEPAKTMLGAVQGGAVRLADGPGPLVVCEGLETGLSLASGLLRTPAMIWAALSTSGIRGLRLPPRPGRLTIASDGDAAGSGAAQALAARAHALGWQVSFLNPPEGCDWNDVLTGKAVAD